MKLIIPLQDKKVLSNMVRFFVAYFKCANLLQVTREIFHLELSTLLD